LSVQKDHGELSQLPDDPVYGTAWLDQSLARPITVAALIEPPSVTPRLPEPPDVGARPASELHWLLPVHELSADAGTADTASDPAMDIANPIRVIRRLIKACMKTPFCLAEGWGAIAR
jgi:hypothetical protein